jgi:hypothetical protein
MRLGNNIQLLILNIFHVPPDSTINCAIFESIAKRLAIKLAIFINSNVIPYS